MSSPLTPTDHEALDCRLPERQLVAMVVASPHSGALYPADFLGQTTLPLAALRRAEHFIHAGLATGAFTPIVDRVFDFDDIVAAYTYVDSPERRLGKPVVRVRHP